VAAFADPAVLADDAGKSLEFARQLVVQFDDFVECVRNVGIDAVIGVLKPDGEIAAPKGPERGENLAAGKLFPGSLDVHGTLL
jgi:hypothetical protein